MKCRLQRRASFAMRPSPMCSTNPSSAIRSRSRRPSRPILVQWLSKRLGTPLAVPDLSSAGFNLVGGRLLPAGQADALGAQGTPGLARALFMFESSAGERVTLYVSVRPPGDEAPAAFRFAQLPGNSTQSFYWLEGRLGYALSGQIARERLAQLGGLVYAQLIKS